MDTIILSVADKHKVSFFDMVTPCPEIEKHNRKKAYRAKLQAIKELRVGGYGVIEIASRLRIGSQAVTEANIALGSYGAKIMLIAKLKTITNMKDVNNFLMTYNQGRNVQKNKIAELILP